MATPSPAFGHNTIPQELISLRYANAIWNFYSQDTTLAQLVHDFCDLGYDAVSLTSAQLCRLDLDATRDIATALDERDMAVTLHGNFDPELSEVLGFIDILAGRLLAVSCDAAMIVDSRGRFYDTARMAPFMRGVLDATAGTDIRVGIEDFPLDSLALEHYRADLEPLLASERYGILIDVGHMHIRLTDGGYFEGVSVADYFADLPLPVIEVHLHDNNGLRDQHGHFGMGSVPFEEVGAALKSLGFDDVSTVEIAPAHYDMEPDKARPLAGESVRMWRELWECGD